MKLSEWLIAGFITTSILLKRADSINCTYRSDTRSADCQGLGLKEVPTDLPPLTEHLDISSNPLIVTEDSFSYLTSLTTLKMRNLDLSSKSSVDDFALRLLDKLEFLDLTGSKFDEFFVFTYPSNIKTLIIDSTTFKSPDLRTIEKLEKLSAKSCNLDNFPTCYDGAPLVCADLSDNSLDYLSVPTISKYCFLEKVIIQYPPSGSDLQSKDSQCRCVELAIWSEEYDIEGITKAELGCFNYDEGEKNCKVNLTDQINERNECLEKYKWVIDWRSLILALIFTAMLLVLLYAIYDRLIRPILYRDQFKPSTTPRPRRPLPKPWPTIGPYRPPRIYLPRTPPANNLPEIEEEEEAEEEEDGSIFGCNIF